MREKSKSGNGITYKKSQGFTLIELLAVIVILAIIALILTPVIGNIVEKSKMNVFRQNVYELMDVARLYQAGHLENIEDITFTCDGITCSSEDKVLLFNGKVPLTGTITISKKSIPSVEFLSDGKYCATGTKDNLVITNNCVTTYVVNHYQMNLDGENYTLVDTEQFIGKLGYDVTPNVKNYDGFKEPNLQTITISQNSNNIINYYYERNEYIVELDTNGGTSEKSSITVLYGGNYNDLPTPVRSGYEFVGWYTEMENGEQITTSDIFNLLSNQTLYAHWNAQTLTLFKDGSALNTDISGGFIGGGVSGTGLKLQVYSTTGQIVTAKAIDLTPYSKIVANVTYYQEKYESGVSTGFCGLGYDSTSYQSATFSNPSTSNYGSRNVTLVVPISDVVGMHNVGLFIASYHNSSNYMIMYSLELIP